MLNKATKYYFYLILFTPLIGYFLRGVYEIKVAVITIFGVIGFMLALWLLFEKEYSLIKKPNYLFIGFLFALYYTAWGFFNGRIEEVGPAKFFIANNHILVLFILILIENTHFSDKFIKNSIFLIKITIIAAFTVSLYQALFDPAFFTSTEYSEEIDYMADLGRYETRNPSIFSFLDQNDYGLSFVPLLSVFVGYHFYIKQTNIFLLSFIVMGGLTCFLTNGRYIMIIYIFLFAQILFLKQLKFPIKIIYLVLSLLLIIAVINILPFFGYDLNKFYDERIMSDSGSSRIVAFDMLGKFFYDNPVFGTGVRTTDELMNTLAGRSSQIHVGYLSTLFEWGIIGGVLLFGFWYKIAKDLYKKAKKSLFYGAFFGFLTFLVANTVLVQYSIFFYGVIFCFIFSKYFYNKADDYNEEHLIYI
jgi:hypothetical protein